MDCGATPTGDLTDVMTQVKLMWLLGRGIENSQELQRNLLVDYLGEITPVRGQALTRNPSQGAEVIGLPA